ncbi:hypothetical protein AVBRAN12654_03095 [Campylobacter sp. RM12654]|uniref:hypothetical protein n=1 Tax=Campylobacter sp. RM12654 TaxID=2735738 RepID=UPI00301568FB|nr:hypothetical protein [Campylobacter sp. RM12654]
MKELLEECIFSNKFVLENVSRSCYGLGIGVIIAIIVAFGVKTDTNFDLLTMSISVIISFLAFLIGILIDNIRKDLK